MPEPSCVDEAAIAAAVKGARKATPDLSHTCLLVIDMQEHFRELASPILPHLKEIISLCRSCSLPIIYTQHMHKEKVDGMLSQWWGSLIREGSQEASLLPEIAPQPGELVIVKRRYSAFYRTALEDHLRSRRIKDLIICGVMTNLCCETTARDAFMRDYRVFFLADGTATASLDLHLATLRNLAFGFAYLLTSAEIVGLLRGQGGG